MTDQLRALTIARHGRIPSMLLALLSVSCVCAASDGLAARLPLSAPTGISMMADAEKLKPGEYLWAPDVAPQGPILIVVSLKTQHAHVYRNGVLIGISTVSTGKAGYQTPTGIFTVLQKHVEHRSNLYENAPMPYMQRLTWSGIALHAGNLPGYPASHGCVRLPLGFAKLLFGITRLGLTVVITDDAAMPWTAPTPAVLTEAPASQGEAAMTMSWQPQRSPNGQLSILISSADARLRVLRNGVEIGSAPVAIRGQLAADRAYVLSAIDAEGLHWQRLPLPGQSAGSAAEPMPEPRDDLTLPPDFRRSLVSILTPGTTLVVTGDPLNPGGTGKQLTVISGEN